MDQLAVTGVDLAAIAVLTFGVYFPRHHRRDLLVTFLAMNAGVFAVSVVLSSSSIGAGVGLGLFGVLSIIRLRSSEIAQHEIAYFFSALAIGLLAGLPGRVAALPSGLMVLIVLVLAVGDHPRLFARHRQRTVRLDAAHTDEDALRSHLAELLGGRIVNLSVKELDLVNDTTLVEARYVADRRPRPANAGVPRELAREVGREAAA